MIMSIQEDFQELRKINGSLVGKDLKSYKKFKRILEIMINNKDDF